MIQATLLNQGVLGSLVSGFGVASFVFGDWGLCIQRLRGGRVKPNIGTQIITCIILVRIKV